MTREELEANKSQMPKSRYNELRAKIDAWEGRSASPQMQQQSYYADTVVNEETLPIQCHQLLQNIKAPQFKPIVKMLKSMCRSIMKQCTPDIVADVYSRLRFTPWDKGVFLTKLSKDRPLADIFNKIKDGNPAYNKDNVFRGELYKYHATFANQQGIGTGVVRTLFHTIQQNIKEAGLFVPTEENSVRHVLNDHLTIEQLRRHGFQVADESEVEYLYELVGEYVAFCVWNKLPIDLQLSRAILTRMLHRDNEIDPDEYVMYYLLDMPQMGTSILNLMRDADSIEHIGLEMNDEFPLVSPGKNEEITADNFVGFLRKKSKHQLTRQLHSDGRDTSKRLQAFIDGFYLRKAMRRANVTVVQLDKLIGGIPITPESIREWLTPTRISTNPDNKSKVKAALWFRDILLDEGRTMPIDELNRANLTEEERKQLFLEFIGRLLYFWSGVAKLDMERVYQVQYITQKGRLPTASTCFYQLRIPVTTTKDKLYRKLIQAAYNVEAGITFYGGRKRKTRKYNA